MLLHRYHNIEYVMGLEISLGIELIRKAQMERRDERIFQQWTSQLSTMALNGTPISFDDYRAEVTGENIDWRPTYLVLSELNGIEKEFKKGDPKNGDGNL